MRPLERLIDRPLPVYLAAALIVLLGVWSLWNLPLKRNPHVVIPHSIVVVPYEGASAEEIESEITIDLDEKLNSLDSLRHLRSVAREGVSIHILEFEDRTDMKESVRSARDEANLASVDFPDDARDVIVEELSFDDLPIIIYSITGAGAFRLREIADDLEPELESVAGVSRVDLFGGFEREVRIAVHPPALAAHGLTLEDLAAAVRRQARNHPAGHVESAASDLLLRSTGEFRHVEEIRSMVVGSEGGHPITLRELADVSVTHQRLTTGSWYDGEPSVALIVRRQPKVNTIETVERLQERVAAYVKQLPPGVQIRSSANSAEITGGMVRELSLAGLYGMVLVLAVLFVMFGLRHALLVSCVLPISLLFAFIGLYVFGMAISNVALFAMILIMGLVVDGAIIVGEAIYRERELGVSSEEAAKRGLRRVGIPVISADLTTIAAFLPMLLMVGVMGQFMSVMPKVVAFALIGSVFADHLLLPAAAAKLGMRRPSRSRRLAPDGLPWFSPELPRMRRLYLSVLEGALRRRGTVIAMGAAAFALMLVVLGSGIVESVFLPYSDRGRFTVDYSLPSGTSLAETDRVGLLIAGHLGSLSEVKSYVLTTGDTGALATDMREGGRRGPEYGRFTVELVKRDDRARSQAEIVGELRQKLSNYAGLDVDVEELQEGPPVGAALAVQIQGPSLDELESVARKVRDRVAGIPGVQDVRVDYERGKPEIRVDLNRTVAAASYGITSDQVARTLLTAFQGVEVGRMWLGEERVDVRLQASEAYPRTIDHIRELPLRTSSGEMIPLGEVAAVRFGLSPNAIFRKDTVRSITVRADAAADSSSVTLDSQARASLATLSLPPRVQIEFLGEKEERDRSYASLWQALKWGLLLIYIVMAVQFNSVIQPFIVLATIPLALVGVVLGLLLTGTPFSFMVFIGIVSLTGIVVNDGIVLIDAINRNRRAGMPMLNAIRDAASNRLRAVILTTVTTIFGILPLTLNLAEGGEFWVPLGIAIIAGLLVASVLTLVVVPVLYSILMGPRWTWRSEPSHRTDPAHAPTPAGGAS